MTLTAEQLQRATQAKSNQLNSCDIIGRSLVSKIVDVKAGDADQPVSIVIDSWAQPWKPSKTSLRVLCACWGNDPSQWVGRYAVLYNDETVTWGGEAIGGIRASHLSHIDGTKKVAVNIKRGKKGVQTVEPYYPQEAQEPTEPTYWPDEAFEKQVAKVRPGDTDAESVIVALEKKALLSEGQKARLRRAAAPVASEAEPVIDEPPPLEEGDDPFAE